MMQREAIAGLRRSRDACLGGVCAGIAQRYDVDPIIIRILALLVAAVTFGLAALAYVALWAALPQEPLSSELYDIAPEQAESSAYGCVDCSKSAHLRGDGESLSIIVWLIVAICLMLLFLLVALNVSPMVKGSEWWQFWPLALSIVGVGLIVIPVHGCREAAWHALGVVITAFAISCLPMSLGILFEWGVGDSRVIAGRGVLLVDHRVVRHTRRRRESHDPHARWPFVAYSHKCGLAPLLSRLAARRRRERRAVSEWRGARHAFSVRFLHNSFFQRCCEWLVNLSRYLGDLSVLNKRQ